MKVNQAMQLVVLINLEMKSQIKAGSTGSKQNLLFSRNLNYLA